VFVIRQDGSYLNSLTLTRLWRWWVVLWWGLIWEVHMWLSSIRITRDDLERFRYCHLNQLQLLISNYPSSHVVRSLMVVECIVFTNSL
jgi:hypothetical protein